MYICIFTEASGKKGKSRKSKGNKTVLDYKKMPASAGGGEHEIKYFEDKQPLTVEKLIRDRESFDHFQSFYKHNPPPAASLPVFNSGGFAAHQYVAPLVTQPEDQFGGNKTYGYAAPPYPSHSWDSGPDNGK